MKVKYLNNLHISVSIALCLIYMLHIPSKIKTKKIIVFLDCE